MSNSKRPQKHLEKKRILKFFQIKLLEKTKVLSTRTTRGATRVLIPLFVRY